MTNKLWVYVQEYTYSDVVLSRTNSTRSFTYISVRYDDYMEVGPGVFAGEQGASDQYEAPWDWWKVARA